MAIFAEFIGALVITGLFGLGIYKAIQFLSKRQTQGTTQNDDTSV